eukprot:SAG31_NODE_1419_length_8430_cov_2.658024_9_plen_45_part_01
MVSQTSGQALTVSEDAGTPGPRLALARWPEQNALPAGRILIQNS